MKANLSDKLVMSWSQGLTFNACQRKYGLTYVDLLRPNWGKDTTLPQMRGTFFHTAMAAYLTYMQAVGKVLWDDKPSYHMAEALKTAYGALADITTEYRTKQVFITIDGSSVVDEDYYMNVERAYLEVKEALGYHIPRMPLGDVYWPVDIEYEFEVDLGIRGRDVWFRGAIDAVMENRLTGELLIVDWKMRANSIPHEAASLVDGQLHAYAAAYMEGNPDRRITQVILWQFLSKLPRQPELSKKDGSPLTGRSSYTTTWDVWSAGVRAAGHDPEEYKDVMLPRLKGEEYFARQTVADVTEQSNGYAWDNLRQVGRRIGEARKDAESGQVNRQLPATLSAHVCKFCSFKDLCGDILRYRPEDAALYLKENYTVGDAPFDPDIEDDTQSFDEA